MSETKHARLRKLDYRSRHRGIREMDIVFGKFAETVLETLSDTELDDYERILELPDDKLFSWATGRETANWAQAGPRRAGPGAAAQRAPAYRPGKRNP